MTFKKEILSRIIKDGINSKRKLFTHNETLLWFVEEPFSRTRSMSSMKVIFTLDDSYREITPGKRQRISVFIEWCGGVSPRIGVWPLQGH